MVNIIDCIFMECYVIRVLSQMFHVNTSIYVYLKFETCCSLPNNVILYSDITYVYYQVQRLLSLYVYGNRILSIVIYDFPFTTEILF